jgi:hypothetical protein
MRAAGGSAQCLGLEPGAVKGIVAIRLRAKSGELQNV